LKNKDKIRFLRWIGNRKGLTLNFKSYYLKVKTGKFKLVFICSFDEELKIFQEGGKGFSKARAMINYCNMIVDRDVYDFNLKSFNVKKELKIFKKEQAEKKLKHVENEIVEKIKKSVFKTLEDMDNKKIEPDEGIEILTQAITKCFDLKPVPQKKHVENSITIGNDNTDSSYITIDGVDFTPVGIDGNCDFDVTDEKGEPNDNQRRIHKAVFKAGKILKLTKN
jgi:hypothetical protein